MMNVAMCLYMLKSVLVVLAGRADRVGGRVRDGRALLLVQVHAEDIRGGLLGLLLLGHGLGLLALPLGLGLLLLLPVLLVLLLLLVLVLLLLLVLVLLTLLLLLVLVLLLLVLVLLVLLIFLVLVLLLGILMVLRGGLMWMSTAMCLIRMENLFRICMLWAMTVWEWRMLPTNLILHGVDRLIPGQ